MRAWLRWAVKPSAAGDVKVFGELVAVFDAADGRGRSCLARWGRGRGRSCRRAGRMPQKRLSFIPSDIKISAERGLAASPLSVLVSGHQSRAKGPERPTG